MDLRIVINVIDTLFSLARVVRDFTRRPRIRPATSGGDFLRTTIRRETRRRGRRNRDFRKRFELLRIVLQTFRIGAQWPVALVARLRGRSRRWQARSAALAGHCGRFRGRSLFLERRLQRRRRRRSVALFRRRFSRTLVILMVVLILMAALIRVTVLFSGAATSFAVSFRRMRRSRPPSRFGPSAMLRTRAFGRRRRFFAARARPRPVPRFRTRSGVFAFQFPAFFGISLRLSSVVGGLLLIWENSKIDRKIINRLNNNNNDINNSDD